MDAMFEAFALMSGVPDGDARMLYRHGSEPVAWHRRVLGAIDRQPGQAVVAAAAHGADAVAALLRAGGRTRPERAMTGPIELEGPDGQALTLQRLPGRGWRWGAAEDTLHYLVAAQPSLRDALTVALPGLVEDDPWLVEALQRLAPEELGG